MANDTSTGYASNWNVPNVNGGQLLTFSSVEFPFLARVAGTKIANSDEYAMSAQYALESAAQPAITEAASTTAPTAVAFERTNESNVVQIYHESIKVTYSKLAATNRLKFAESGTSGYAYSSDPLQNAIANELAFQSARAQEQIYADLEYTSLQGAYAKSTAANVANKTRGVITAVTSNTVDASSGQLEKAHLNELLREMATNGAKFRRLTIFANAYQKQKLTDIYSFVPMDRNIGGGNIQMIETDFGLAEVVFNRNMPTGTLLVADMAYVYLVNEPVPGKAYMPDGLLFMEELSKTGAAEAWQIYGQLGLDYGGEKLHGTITSLATA